MARIRTIKPEFWQHEELSALPEATHLLAAALLNYADDEGYFNANPSLVKAACSPLRESSVSTQDSLQQLANIGYVRLGKGADGKRYGQVAKFTEHQRINRATPSKIKDVCIVWDGSQQPHTQISEESHPEGKGTGKGMEQGMEAASAADVGAPPLVLTPPEPPAPALIPDPTYITLTLVTDAEYPITVGMVAEFEKCYPAVDVNGELGKMRAWCLTNKRERKTAAGILKFVNGWLAREQDKSRPAPQRQGGRLPQTGLNELDHAAGIKKDGRF